MGVKSFGINKISVGGSNFEVGFGYSKFVRLKLNNRRIIPVFSATANVFGSNKEDRTKDKIFCKIEEEKECLRLYAKSKGLDFPRWIGGAPTIRIGEGIWGPQSGLKFKQVKDYKDIQTTIDFKHEIKQGFSDLSYDIWLTKEIYPVNFSETTRQEDLEIMIILDSNFKFPWKVIGETENFIIIYEDKNKNPLARDRGHCVAFIPKKPTNKFNILSLIELCSEFLKKDFSKHFIRSFDIINEFAKDTETIVKITKLDLEIKEK
jgi:hypothetical protein